MRRIINDSVSLLKNGKWHCKCKCGIDNQYSNRATALAASNRGTCSNCHRHWSDKIEEHGIFLYDGKWSNRCSGCNSVRSYTRKDHARTSLRANTVCRKCSALIESDSKSIGNFARMYNKYCKSSISRGIEWGIDLDYMESIYTGKCSLTGWDLNTDFKRATASLDRIDSNLGYINGNVQWVHTMVNMCKNKYDQDRFIEMCISISNNMKG